MVGLPARTARARRRRAAPRRVHRLDVLRSPAGHPPPRLRHPHAAPPRAARCAHHRGAAERRREREPETGIDPPHRNRRVREHDREGRDRRASAWRRGPQDDGEVPAAVRRTAHRAGRNGRGVQVRPAGLRRDDRPLRPRDRVRRETLRLRHLPEQDLRAPTRRPRPRAPHHRRRRGQRRGVHPAVRSRAVGPSRRAGSHVPRRQGRLHRGREGHRGDRGRVQPVAGVHQERRGRDREGERVQLPRRG